MPYRLKHGESVAEGVKRIAREQAASAIDHLSGRGAPNREEAIHEARKDIKKLRALIRLVQPHLGDTFAAENIRLRDVSRKLSQVRDAFAMIKAFDDLKQGHRNKLARAPAAKIRTALVRHREHVEEELGIADLMKTSAAAMRDARKSIEAWPLEADGFPAIEPGFEKTYRRGRKALATAAKTARREDFHEWRKRVKDHWYHVRLLEDLWSDVMKGYEDSLKDLEDHLGEDLTLALLRDYLRSVPEKMGSQMVASAVDLIDEDRKDLREKALDIGNRIYGRKPRKVVTEMRRLWSTWNDNV